MRRPSGTPCIVKFAFPALFLLSVTVVLGQEGLQPKFEIPSAIAKLPERADFEGKWLRGDGTYRMEVEVGPETVTARYFNPNPVNVESARIEVTEEIPELIVILRDQGYDGSTYRLRYFPERMALVGTYNRPRMQPAEVYFVSEGE